MKFIYSFLTLSVAALSAIFYILDKLKRGLNNGLLS